MELIVVEKAKKTVAAKDKDLGFKKGDFVVYPTHGVGKVMGIESQEISGHSLQVIIILFDKDRMTLRVPVAKAKNSGLRKLSSKKVMETALQTLKGRSRVKRAMWSRRAQEYEAKINSGDPVSIAEVVRDLHRISPTASGRSTRLPLIAWFVSLPPSKAWTSRPRPNACIR
jgi:CarD family transcriptional regulator